MEVILEMTDDRLGLSVTQLTSQEEQSVSDVRFLPPLSQHDRNYQCEH